MGCVITDSLNNSDTKKYHSDKIICLNGILFNVIY